MTSKAKRGAAAILELRRALLPGADQKTFAKLLGVTQSAISGWERGKITPPDRQYLALGNLAAAQNLYELASTFWKCAGLDGTAMVTVVAALSKLKPSTVGQAFIANLTPGLAPRILESDGPPAFASRDVVLIDRHATAKPGSPLVEFDGDIVVVGFPPREARGDDAAAMVVPGTILLRNWPMDAREVTGRLRVRKFVVPRQVGGKIVLDQKRWVATLGPFSDPGGLTLQSSELMVIGAQTDWAREGSRNDVQLDACTIVGRVELWRRIPAKEQE